MNVSPAGEWLLDNLHVVQEHIREVRESLPRGYYRELPELASGMLAGYPRVYEIAITLISHTEARVELDNVDLFLGAFQQVRPLVIGELWAIPAMLRLGLIESVRRMALRTVRRLEELESADEWTARLVDAGDESGAARGGRAQRVHQLSTAPHAHLRLPLPRPASRGRRRATVAGPAASDWIAEHGMPAEEAAARATERVALTQLTMANSITSLRGIARMDWEAFVERQSAMEATLRQDPAGVYARMTFVTRDQYRHVVERIARRSERRRGHRGAQSPSSWPAPRRPTARAEADRRRHVGYYLVDEGLAQLERLTGYRPAGRPHGCIGWALRHPNVVFVGGVLAGTVAALLARALAGRRRRRAPPGRSVLLFALHPRQRHRASRR